ncbi:MAG: 50S ribosomal protein L30 [Christensenellaceae bacterium]|jgi:large subunit ribosomal protein L30|nr:50S ribosomal protein L30 [Christensenellaceae bacterium]
MAKIKVTLVRSTIGALPNQKKCVIALGLGKTNSSNVLEETAAIKGILVKVAHLVKVEAAE